VKHCRSDLCHFVIIYTKNFFYSDLILKYKSVREYGKLAMHHDRTLSTVCHKKHDILLLISVVILCGFVVLQKGSVAGKLGRA